MHVKFAKFNAQSSSGMLSSCWPVRSFVLIGVFVMVGQPVHCTGQGINTECEIASGSFCHISFSCRIVVVLSSVNRLKLDHFISKCL